MDSDFGQKFFRAKKWYFDFGQKYEIDILVFWSKIRDSCSQKIKFFWKKKSRILYDSGLGQNFDSDFSQKYSKIRLLVKNVIFLFQFFNLAIKAYSQKTLRKLN